MDLKASPARLAIATIGQQRHFRTFGFLQRRQVLDNASFDAIVQDYHRAMRSDDLRLPFNELGQLPAFVASCMSEASTTIVDLATHEETMILAESLLGRPAICVHAFAYQRSEDTRWHSDNIDATYQGLKLYVNLESVDANSGALRVIVGSHRDGIRRNLIPGRYETAEQQFELAAAELPATVLTSQPGDINAFDLSIWHAVCGSRTHRRVIELTYYQAPESARERSGFVAQMQAHQHQSQLSGTTYYPHVWRKAGGPRHQRGLDVLAEMGLLETDPFGAGR